MPNTFVDDGNGYFKEVNEKGEIVGWSKKIDPGDGLRKTIFKGKTRQEVTDQLEESYRQATRRIVQQEKQIKLGQGMIQPDPEEVLPTFTRRDLTADEQWAIAHGITDATKAPAALRTAIEAEFGAPIETVRQTLRKTAEMDSALRARAEGDKFTAAHPEYIICPENGRTIIAYLEKNKMAPTARNMEIALNDLHEVLKLRDPNQAEVTVPPETPPDNPGATRTDVRPRSASTALTDRNSSATRVQTKSALNGPSLEQIELMTASQFEDWSRNPANAAYYEQLVKQKSGR